MGSEHTAVFARVAGGVRRKDTDALGGALKHHALLCILQKQSLHATEDRRIYERKMSQET